MCRRRWGRILREARVRGKIDGIFFFHPNLVRAVGALLHFLFEVLSACSACVMYVLVSLITESLYIGNLCVETSKNKYGDRWLDLFFLSIGLDLGMIDEELFFQDQDHQNDWPSRLPSDAVGF